MLVVLTRNSWKDCNKRIASLISWLRRIKKTSHPLVTWSATVWGTIQAVAACPISSLRGLGITFCWFCHKVSLLKSLQPRWGHWPDMHVMSMNGMTEGATFTHFDCNVVMSAMMETIWNVTGFDKTLYMGFFVKIEFGVYLISSTIELFTRSETDRALRLGASALCLRLRHTHGKWEITV